MTDEFRGKIIRGDSGSVAQKSFAIVVSKYNELITDKLLSGAIATLAEHGVPDQQIRVAWVPGAWEIPLIANRLASQSVDAVICLGAVIRGETSHDQHINRTVSAALGQISIETGKPIAFGVLTCNTLEQAIERAGGGIGNKGVEAADAAIAMLKLLDELA